MKKLLVKTRQGIKWECRTMLLALILLLLPLTHTLASGRGDRETVNQENRTYQVILLRHGESYMNVERRTSGWGDTRLTERGIAAGIAVGERMKNQGISIDAIHTSYLARAIKTAWLALEGMDMMWIPVHTDWRLNETKHGAFEGKTRDEQIAEFGEELMRNWDLTFDMRPPVLPPESPNPASDQRYSHYSNIPQTESMQDTLDRITAYWQDVLIPVIRATGDTIMVVGHTNVLRALSKAIDDSIDITTLRQMDIPNTVPIIYTLDANMRPISRRVIDAN